MLTYNMEARGRQTRVDFLYQSIKNDILSGRLAAGEKLPSKRSLAEHLQLSVVTVENAYAQLVAEGYLDAREKRGYFVIFCTVPGAESVSFQKASSAAFDLRSGGGVPFSVGAESVPSPKMSGWALDFRSSGDGTKAVPESAPYPKAPVWALDLRSSGGGTEGFPFSVWAKLMRQVLTQRGKDLLRAMPHSGAEELRTAIGSYLYHFRGMSVQPEQIVVGAGTEYLCNLIVQLLGRDQCYGVEDPGYSKAAKVYALNGASTIPIPVDEQGVSPEEIEISGATVLHISPSHQFPTGAVTPIARRQGLLRWAEGGRYIIEDDYDSEFRFVGRPIPTLQSIDRSGRVIYLNTFSRSLAPSLRISYMVLPLSMIEAYQEKLGFYSSTVPAMEQYTLARFLSEGYFESHVNRMRVFYRGLRDQVIQSIQESPLRNHCQIFGEDAGLHFLVKLETDKGDEALTQLAAQRDIRLSFVSDYERHETAAHSHTLVVNYPGVDLNQLKWALEQLAEII